MREHVARSGRRTIRRVLQVTSGNFLEAFDLIVFGLLASQIARNFFPAQNALVGLMSAFLTFAVAFVVRPVGAIVLGPVFDRHGRRHGLIVCLSVTAIGTALVAITPGYSTIGVFAPILVLFGRILQGIAIGAESGGVSVYLYEIATPGREGFFVAWNAATFMLSSAVAGLISYALNSALSPEQFNSWGWRLPILLGCAAIPMVFYFRRALEETSAFQVSAHPPRVSEVWRTLARGWPVVLNGAMLIGLSGSMFYFVATTVPAVAKTVLHLSMGDSLEIAVISSLTCFVLVPTFGALSDRIGRRTQLLTFSALAFLTPYPVLGWLSGNVSFSNVLAANLWFSILYSGYNGAAIVALTELVPKRIRTSAYGVASTFGLAIFSGFTPAVVTWLIHRSGKTADGAYWIMGLSVLAAFATIQFYSKKSAVRRVLARE